MIIEASINEIIHDERVSEWLRHWLADFHKTAMTYTPDHISGDSPVYIVVPLYHSRSYIGSGDVIENVLYERYTTVKMIIYYPHFEHCDIAELQILFSALQLLVNEALYNGIEDIVEPTLQEFSCNLEYIVFNIAFPSLWNKGCPFRKLILDYAPEILVREISNML